MGRARKLAIGGAGALLLIALVLFVTHPTVSYPGFVTTSSTGTIATACPSPLNRSQGDHAPTSAAVRNAYANYRIAYPMCATAASDREQLSIASLILAALLTSRVIVSKPKLRALVV